jgi:hypothetical protein
LKYSLGQEFAIDTDKREREEKVRRRQTDREIQIGKIQKRE